MTSTSSYSLRGGLNSCRWRYLFTQVITHVYLTLLPQSPMLSLSSYISNNVFD